MSRAKGLALVIIFVLGAWTPGYAQVQISGIEGVTITAGKVPVESTSSDKVDTDFANRVKLVGGVARDADASQVYPVVMGGCVSIPVAPAMSTLGDSGCIWIDANGAVVTRGRPTSVSKDAAYTTTQTGTAVWTPASGFRPVVTSVEFQCGGTTAGNIRLWFGATADTTFSQGTDQVLSYFDCNTPSATNAPHKEIAFPAPVSGLTVDYILRATTSANLTVVVVVHGFEQ